MKKQEHQLKRLVLATIMREQGGSGLQTYLNTFHNYLNKNQPISKIVTPFSYSPIIIVPLFGLRKLINVLSRDLSIKWYEYWHFFILKQVLKRMLKNNSKLKIPTSVYAQCPLSAKAALEARTGPEQKVFMVVHFNLSQADEWVEKGMIKPGSKQYKSIKARETNVISSLDGIVYVSKFMKGIIEMAISKANAIRSVCLPCFTNQVPQSDKISELKGDLISIGTLEYRKNHAYLLKVIFHAKVRGYCYTLTLVGDGPEYEKLKDLANLLEISAQVKFAGYQRNAMRFLSNHRVYVHSALIENMPIALLEALAVQLPIIAGPVGGIPEIFEDGIEGFYWPLNDSKKGAEILICLLENQDVYSNSVTASAKRYQHMFQTENIATQLSCFLSA